MKNKSNNNELDKVKLNQVRSHVKRDGVNFTQPLTKTSIKSVDRMKKVVSDAVAVGSLLDDFARTTDDVVTLEELRRMLLSGRQLRMKFGVDVTAPDLHIGHAVNLWMYRRLQEMGHKVIFLIGDFTTQIGDPTGKDKLRPIISAEDIQKNADEFLRQVGMVLVEDPDVLEIRRNSEWLGPMTAKELLSLLSTVTHDHLVSRDMFRKRIEEGREIYEHELIYPVLQGYDSVMLESDLTIIGSDQLFNEMLGRSLQSKFGQSPQVILTTRITPGIDGRAKQSKSLGNYIGLSHSPREKFGRVMSMPDNLIVQYFEVYTEVPVVEIEAIKDGLADDPMKYKLQLAREIVKRYHGETVADEELAWFARTFSQRHAPSDAATVSVGAKEMTGFDLLRQCMPASQASNSELRRLILQRAVTADGRPVGISDVVEITTDGILVRVGKRRWFRVVS